MATVCLPEHRVEIVKICDPQDCQDEESKEPVTFELKVVKAARQFSQIVDQIEGQLKLQKSEIEQELQKAAQPRQERVIQSQNNIFQENSDGKKLRNSMDRA